MPLFPREMESERLHYRYVHPDADHVDVVGWYDYHREGAPGIEEATRYMRWDPHETPKETQGFVDHCGELFDEGDGVTYAMYPKEGQDGVPQGGTERSSGERSEPRDGAREFAGTAGLDVEWDRRTAVLGVWFRKPFWGRGYSGERAARLMRLAFERLDLDIVAVEHVPNNEKSRRAIEKYVERFGGRREGTIRNRIVAQDGSVDDAVRYSVSQAEWRANRD